MSLDPSSLLRDPAGLPEEPEALDWLVGLLREVMTAVAAEEGDTLKKAGMIARLGGLLLKASGASEMKRSYKELVRHHAELEERLAALEAPTAEAPASLHLEPVTPEEARRPVGRPAALLAAVVTPRGNVLSPVATGPDALPTLVIGASAHRTRDRPTV